jgi:hypothetical protein
VKTSFFRGLALAAAIASAACSADGTNGASALSSPGEMGSADGMGTVGAQLTLPAGQLIEVVKWIIAGPNNAGTVVQSGSVDVPTSNVASFLASNIPAGSGYRVTLSGTSIDGSVTCTGSASFNVTSHMVTQVPVAMACSVAMAGSQVTLVSGQSFDCATVTNVTAVPAETAVGATISLTAAAAGPVPSALSYAWSAPSGSFSAANAASTSFTCSAAGAVPITLTTADGPVPTGAACNVPESTRTVTVLCDAVQAGTDAGGPTNDGGAPPAVPALPSQLVLLMGIGMLGAGVVAARRRAQGTH